MVFNDEIIKQLKEIFKYFRRKTQYAVIYIPLPDGRGGVAYRLSTNPDELETQISDVINPALDSTMTEYPNNFAVAVPDERGRVYGFELTQVEKKRYPTIHSERLLLQLVFPRMLEWYRREFHVDSVPEVFLYTYFLPCQSCFEDIQALQNENLGTAINVGYSYFGRLEGREDATRQEAEARRDALHAMLREHGGGVYHVIIRRDYTEAIGYLISQQGMNVNDREAFANNPLIRLITFLYVVMLIAKLIRSSFNSRKHDKRDKDHDQDPSSDRNRTSDSKGRKSKKKAKNQSSKYGSQEKSKEGGKTKHAQEQTDSMAEQLECLLKEEDRQSQEVSELIAWLQEGEGLNSPDAIDDLKEQLQHHKEYFDKSEYYQEVLEGAVSTYEEFCEMMSKFFSVQPMTDFVTQLTDKFQTITQHGPAELAILEFCVSEAELLENMKDVEEKLKEIQQQMEKDDTNLYDVLSKLKNLSKESVAECQKSLDEMKVANDRLMAHSPEDHSLQERYEQHCQNLQVMTEVQQEVTSNIESAIEEEQKEQEEQAGRESNHQSARSHDIGPYGLKFIPVVGGVIEAAESISAFKDGDVGEGILRGLGAVAGIGLDIATIGAASSICKSVGKAAGQVMVKQAVMAGGKEAAKQVGKMAARQMARKAAEQAGKRLGMVVGVAIGTTIARKVRERRYGYYPYPRFSSSFP